MKWGLYMPTRKHIIASKRKFSELTYEEQYELGYLKGIRIGKIEVIRKILINCLHLKGKEQGTGISNELIQKINREIDTEFLVKIIFNVFDDKLSIKDIDTNYHTLFLIPCQEKAKKYLCLSPSAQRKRNELT